MAPRSTANVSPQFGSAKPSPPSSTKPLPIQSDGAADEDMMPGSPPDPVALSSRSSSAASPMLAVESFVASPRPGRMLTTGNGSWTASPVLFDYPYSPPMPNGSFAGSCTQTAIRG